MIYPIRIVLHHPSHPGNIGASARAMKTMGLNQLFLVAPKQFPHDEANALAAGAEDILQHAQIVTTLTEALHDCVFVVGTSARQRDIDLPATTPRTIAPLMHHHAQFGPVALVFGCERSGLSNDDLACCHQHLTIPTQGNYQSLNLSQAVQIIAYELLLAQQTTTIANNKTSLAPYQEIHAFYQHLQQALIHVGYLKPHAPKKLMPRLQRLFQRSQLQPEEITLLRGICKSMLRLIPNPQHTTKEENT